MIRKRLLGCSGVLLLAAGLGVAQKPSLSEQQKRGHELFVNSQKGAPCATCHSLAGEGRAVGPDLRNLAGNATPAGLRMAILATLTSYVQLVKLENGTVFPGMKIEGAGGELDYWDLSKMPPEKRTLKKSDVDSVSNNNQWKHPPESTGYSDGELSDVISYLRYVAKNDPIKN